MDYRKICYKEISLWKATHNVQAYLTGLVLKIYDITGITGKQLDIYNGIVFSAGTFIAPTII